MQPEKRPIQYDSIRTAHRERASREPTIAEWAISLVATLALAGRLVALPVAASVSSAPQDTLAAATIGGAALLVAFAGALAWVGYRAR